jgi:type I restriction enzyme S subunit
MSWSIIPLGDIAEFRNGLNYTQKNQGEGLPVINVKDFQDRSIPDYNGLDEINPIGLINEESLLKDGDIIFVRSNGNKDLIGRSMYISDPPSNLSFSAFCIRARIKEPEYSRFYAYFFRSPNFRKKLSLLGSGTNISNLNQQVLKKIEVPHPSIIQQKAVVDILSPYDDLIDNNRRRIQLLEEAARLLYQEWFVRLRFPGHEHTKIVDGVPDGWKKSPLSELCELINYGYTESAVNEEIGPKFLRITDIVPSSINWDSVPYCKIEECKKEKFLLKEGDIVIARTGATVGHAKRINKRHPESVYASYLVRLRLNSEIDNKIIGILLESDFYKDYVKSNVGGAAQPNANAKVLTRFELLVAPKKIQQEFSDIISPILDQKEILQDLSQQLIKARDLLLPRLMNGVIPV